MKYTLYIDYEQDLIPYEDCTNSPTELEVTYEVVKGFVIVRMVKTTGQNAVHLLPMLIAIDGDKTIKSICRMDNERRNVKAQFDNYPDLDEPLTQDQQSDLLKLK